MSRKRKLIWLIVLILSAVLLYPSLPSMEPIISDTNSINVVTRDIEIKTEQARSAQDKGDTFILELESVRKQIPSNPDLESLVDELSVRIAGVGMRWTDGSPGALEQSNAEATYRTWQLSLTIQGPQSSVLPLLDSIATMDRTVTLDSVSIRAEGQQVVVSLNAKFYALLPTSSDQSGGS